MYRDSRHGREGKRVGERIAISPLSPDWRYNNFCGRRSGVRHERKSLPCVSLVERSDVDEIIKFLLTVVLLGETASKLDYITVSWEEEKEDRATK